MKKLKALFLVMAALAVTTMFTSCEAFAKALSDTMSGPMKVQVMNRCPISKINDMIAIKVSIYEVDSNYANPSLKKAGDFTLRTYSSSSNSGNTQDFDITLEAGQTYKVVVENKTASSSFNSFTCEFVAAAGASKGYVNNDHLDCFIPTGYNTYKINLYNTSGSKFQFVIEKEAIPR